MKRIQNGLLLSALLLIPLLFSCKTKQYTPKTYKGPQLVAGTSGGVTGMIKEYTLLGNGQVFLSKGIAGEWREKKVLKKSTARSIFKKAESLGLSELRYKHPGNMTYYLILKQPPRSNEIKWGEAGTTPPEGVIEFYDYLLTIF